MRALKKVSSLHQVVSHGGSLGRDSMVRLFLYSGFMSLDSVNSLSLNDFRGSFLDSSLDGSTNITSEIVFEQLKNVQISSTEQNFCNWFETFNSKLFCFETLLFDILGVVLFKK